MDYYDDEPMDEHEDIVTGTFRYFDWYGI
jgi:hypothetical protein